MAAANRAIFLREALEQVSHEITLDADAVIRDRDGDLPVGRPHADLHVALSRREFYGVADEVPDDLLHATRVRHHEACAGIDAHLESQALGSGGGADCI